MTATREIPKYRKAPAWMKPGTQAVYHPIMSRREPNRVVTIRGDVFKAPSGDLVVYTDEESGFLCIEALDPLPRKTEAARASARRARIESDLGQEAALPAERVALLHDAFRLAKEFAPKATTPEAAVYALAASCVAWVVRNAGHSVKDVFANIELILEHFDDPAEPG